MREETDQGRSPPLLLERILMYRVGFFEICAMIFGVATVIQFLLFLYLNRLYQAKYRSMTYIIDSQLEVIRDQDIHITALQKALQDRSWPVDGLLTWPADPNSIEIWLN